MSSDYRPRGGGSSGGPRRRRGGRGRGHQGGSHSENRVYTNGSSTTPAKKESVLSKLFGWLTGKKSKPEAKQPFRSSVSPARPEYKERTARAERIERSERPQREERPPKPEPTLQEIVTAKLYIGNLAYEAAESDLFDLFSKVGAVKNVEIAMDRRANRSKGFGFVEMETLETAKEAAAKLNRTDFMGRQILVSGAKLDKRPIQSSRDADAPVEAEPTTSHESATSQDTASGTASSPESTT